MTESQAEIAAKPSASMRGSLLWLVSGVLAAGALSVVASVAPENLKKLGLLPALLGVATGAALVWLAREFRPGWRKSRVLLAFLLAVAATVNLGWLSFRRYQAARENLAQQNPRHEAMLNMLEDTSQNDPQALAKYAAERRQLHPHFEDYLAHRVSALGKWQQPWPELFWGGEILLAGTLCALVVRRSLS